MHRHGFKATLNVIVNKGEKLNCSGDLLFFFFPLRVHVKGFPQVRLLVSVSCWQKLQVNRKLEGG